MIVIPNSFKLLYISVITEHFNYTSMITIRYGFIVWRNFIIVAISPGGLIEILLFTVSAPQLE